MDKSTVHIGVVAGLTALLLAAHAPILADEPRVSLKGYDTVAYFTASRPVKGTPAIHMDWDGSRYHFASAKNRETFAGDPDRYMPQFRGLCAAGLSYGKHVEADPTVWKIIDGKLYVFGGPNRVEMQEKDADLIARAHRNWKAAPR